MKHAGLLLVLGLCLLSASVPAGQTAPPPAGIWQVEPNPVFPERYSPPGAFVAFRLDEAGLDALLAGAPRETFGPIPPDAVFPLPLPTGTLAPMAAATTMVMESALAAQFPEIRTYVFAGSRDGISGRMAVGPGGVHFVAQTVDGMMRVEPVETASGRVYVSYLDALRTDGLNDHDHPPDAGENDQPLPPAIARPHLGALDFTTAVSAGDQLRIYRLAASTTGEFFQARAGGNGTLGVLFSLIVDLNGANAIFEPEVSVRLILALTTLDLLYDDPDTDPFDNDAEACDLRNANRDNLIAESVPDADYDLSFLFAARDGGGANGCAWFVVCLTSSNTLHKGRGAGKMGNNGLNGAGGLLAHEVGHMLGARHTFTGEDGSCTLNEFLAGDSESGYEPGSGTTRMSYRGNCDDDDVNTDLVPAGSYFHSRSFDEIVDNVFSGDGSTCGTLVQTGNSAPVVDAGPDYTIPRGTPFTLTGSAMDSEPLTYNWEQFDRAVDQRPINTDPGDGPIVRSVPPGTDPSRTIPNLQDLLDNFTRKGEILPQTDRDLNFRMIARDNLMGGGGVAYDDMVVHVSGDPFFITSPNSGVLEAGCALPITWEVGGGSVAPTVSALFSSDGGQTFPTVLAAGMANDGSGGATVPCDTGGGNRIKLQSDGNIFFDINDEPLTIVNPPPVVNVSTAGGAVNDACEFTVEFTATATDSCGLNAANVTVQFFQADDNFTLGAPVVNIQQVSATEVGVSGSVVVSDLLSSPAQLAVSVSAVDACGAQTEDFDEAVIVDDTPPEIDVTLDPTVLWPPNHAMIPVTATVVAADNCPGVSFALTSLASSEPDNATGDGNTPGDIQEAELGTADIEFLLRRERAGHGDGRVYTAVYTATDGSGNEAQDQAVVLVPKSQK
jgi:hypothetical protein